MGIERYRPSNYYAVVAEMGSYVAGLATAKIRSIYETVHIADERREFTARIEDDIDVITQSLTLQARKELLYASPPHHEE